MDNCLTMEDVIVRGNKAALDKISQLEDTLRVAIDGLNILSSAAKKAIEDLDSIETAQLYDDFLDVAVAVARAKGVLEYAWRECNEGGG